MVNSPVIGGLAASLVLSAIGISWLAQPLDAIDQPTSEGAKSARTRFLDQVTKLDADYLAKLNKAREEYVRDLEAPRKTSLSESDLDEAQRILAMQASIQDDMKAQRAPARGLHIIAARWGAQSRWVDVSSKVQERIKASALTLTPESAGFPDPIDGTRKALVVVYAYNGRVDVAVVGHDERLQLPVPKLKR